MTSWGLWRRALCLLAGHRLPSQTGELLKSSHVRCTCCGEMVRAPIEAP